MCGMWRATIIPAPKCVMASDKTVKYVALSSSSIGSTVLLRSSVLLLLSSPPFSALPSPSAVSRTRYVYASLINACEQSGEWKRALELFQAMQAEGIEFSSITMLAKRALYTWPQLTKYLPPPVVSAAWAAVETGRAARRWVDNI